MVGLATYVDRIASGEGSLAGRRSRLFAAVVASAVVVALGIDLADPPIGLAITIVILRITWQSWLTVRAG